MRILALFAIGLVFGAGAGFVAAAGMGVSFDGHDHGDPAHHAAAAPHAAAHAEAIEVGGEAAVPELDIALSRDPVAGYNLHLRVENFAFAPEQAGGAHVPGQGHAHVYVDGVKRGRIYGPWVHLDGLPEGGGAVVVEVTLNANSHAALTRDGEPIRARAVLETGR